MDKAQYPEDLMIEIIHKLAEIEVEREQWLRLRLVNKLFNKHVLFTIFVLDDWTIDYVPIAFLHAQFYGSRSEWLAPKFATLHRSWWLQGQVIKPHIGELDIPLHFQSNQHTAPQGWWKQMADDSALLVAEYVDVAGSKMIESLILTGFVSSISTPISVIFQKAREIICDAVASLSTIEGTYMNRGYLEPMIFLGRTRTFPPTDRFDWAPCDFFFLTTCFLGDLDAVQHSLKMIDHAPRTLEDSERLRSAGLYLAIRHNHRQLISFLLTSDVKVSDQNWVYILCAAVQTGNVSMLQHFLGAEYSEERDMARLCQVLDRAAEYTDTTVRIEMCKVLLNFCDHLNTIELRTRLLLAACRSDDVAFADWIIKTGPVNFYDQEARDGSHSPHPLLIATYHGSTNVLRFLLQFKFEVYQDTDQIVIDEAIRHALTLGRFDSFMSLVPYHAQISKAEILERAATIDHGLEAVDKLLDLAEVTPAEIPEGAKESGSSRIMENAVEYQFVSNIEWLLQHGFRTEKVVSYLLDTGQHRYDYGCKPRSKHVSKSKRAIF